MSAWPDLLSLNCGTWRHIFDDVVSSWRAEPNAHMNISPPVLQLYFIVRFRGV